MVLRTSGDFWSFGALLRYLLGNILFIFLKLLKLGN